MRKRLTAAAIGLATVATVVVRLRKKRVREPYPNGMKVRTAQLSGEIIGHIPTDSDDRYLYSIRSFQTGMPVSKPIPGHLIRPIL